MPRGARIVLANHPHHVVQRGHNRQAVFMDDDDYRYYLAIVREWKAELECRVYAYCLMTNHIHLLVDPGADPHRLAMLMKRVASRQTRLVNRLQQRSGTLWEGRFRSSPIETDRYLLACCRYIETNPVRAGMASLPEEYPWSSCRSHLGITRTAWLDDLPIVPPEANSFFIKYYRQLLYSQSSPEELTLIRQAVHRCQLTGGEDFIETVDRMTGCRIERRGPGRPRRIEASPLQ